MSNYSWICPYCNTHTTITHEDQCSVVNSLTIENHEGPLNSICRFIVCPNPQCKKTTLEASLHRVPTGAFGHVMTGEKLKYWRLMPSSSAKTFPDYIPTAIIADYNEACLIRELSPKASATLARRCIQGVIRDYWKVKPGRLVDEIEQIRDKVDPLVWESIEAIRKIGNIGAHMEKNIDLIVEVDPQEANLLLELIELLLSEWYISRHKREEKLSKIIQLGSQKQEQRKNQTS